MKPSKLVLAILLLAICCPACAQFDPGDVKEPSDLTKQAIAGTDPWTTPLLPVFQSAAKKYNVPLPLLLTLAYYGSSFENRGGAPTIEGGYGVMALRDNTLGGTSLTDGAVLIGSDATTLKTDPALNIQAAAAVLDKYAKDKGIDRTQGLQAWLSIVIKYAGLDDENARFFAGEVYDKLKAGLAYTNAAGEVFEFAPQTIGTVNTQALMPPPIVGTADYGPAIWDPAASCNYNAYYTAKDTVIIHTIEGTAAGARSWFKNCSAQVSAHYVTSEAGGVWQCVDEDYKAWHVGCLNSRSIGIENEGYASSSSHPQSLYDACGLLVRDICNSWGIPKEHRSCPPGILGHIDANVCVCGGTHWDPGNGWDWSYFIGVVQGSPPPPSYAAHYNAQSYPSTMVAGSTATAWAEYVNDGTATWGHAATRLGTSSPQDRSSQFYNSGNWISANRPTEVDQSAVTTGQIGRFAFILKAPTTPGTYVEKFRPVEEGITWFGGEVTWTIIVTPAKGNITGTVRDSATGQPISGATVSISGGASTTTNSSGVYTLNDIDAGTYTLNASASLYNPASASVTVDAGATTTKDLSLVPTDTQAPTAPTGLAATAVSPSQINLAWSASTDDVGVTAYLVYRGGVQIGTTSSTSYQDNGLAANTSYSYYVKAQDAANNLSSASSTASATTFPGQVPIFEDGFADLGYWENIVQSPMPGPYPPVLSTQSNHATFGGIYSLKTRNSTDPNQGCLIGHRFTPAFGVAKFETYFFDGTGMDYKTGFDGTTDGWVSYPSAYATLTSVGGGVSGNCLQASDGGWTSGCYKEITSGFIAGESYTFSMYAKWPAPAAYGTQPRVFVRFFDGAGAEIRTDYSGNCTTDNAWHSYTVSGTIPAGTTKIWVGHWAILNATNTYQYFADTPTFSTRGGAPNNDSRQGLQIRCITPEGGLKAIYYLGTYSVGGPTGAGQNYSLGYYKVCGTGCTGWYWTYNIKTRSAGWHKLTLDFLPYTGTGDVKAYIDDQLVGTVDRTLDTQTYGLGMVAYGFHYRVNQEAMFDDVAMYATQPYPSPAMGTPQALSTSAIRWNFTDNSNNESGFKVIDAAAQTKASTGALTGTASVGFMDEGSLAPNTPYTRYIRAYNGTLDSFNSSSATKWTLSTSPSTSNITCAQVSGGWQGGQSFAFTAVGGFGEGTVSGYRYVWDQNPTYSFTGSETKWESGDLLLTASAQGGWYLHVQGINGEGVANGILDLGPYQYDGNPPTNPTSAAETHGAADGVWQSTVADPAFTWSGATDDGSGIADYLVYFGPDEQGTSTMPVTSAAYDPDAVGTGTYYLRVRARDNAGNAADEWATLFTFRYDSTAPAAPTIADDGPYSGSRTKLHATWHAADPDSGIAEYQYAVGTTSGGIDTLGWTTAGTAEDVVITVPTLTVGSTYYISVKAKNGAGAWSDPASTDGIQVAAEQATIADAKAQADDTPVALVNKIVTAGSEGSFYVEEGEHYSGILVKGPLPDGAAAGALVTVGGRMGLSNGERAILDPASIMEAAPDPSRIPPAFLMLGRDMGGENLNAYTPGATDRVGVNNIGLLVRICGWYGVGDEHTFYVNDGCAAPTKVIAYGTDLSGYSASDYLVITGIISLEQSGSSFTPIIRVLSGGSITKVN